MSDRAMLELVTAMRQQVEMQTKQLARHDEERAQDRADQEKRSLMTYLLLIRVEPYSGDPEPRVIEAFIQKIINEVEGTELTTDLFLTVFSRNLTGKAKQWYDQEKEAESFISIEDFKERLINHFAKQVDVQAKFNEFNNLTHSGSIVKFNEKFDKVRNELSPGLLPDPTALGLYVAKLKMDVQREVRLKHPNSLHEAMQIAEIYSEEKQAVTRNKHLPRYLRLGLTPRKEYSQREVSAMPMEVDTVNVKKPPYYSNTNNRNKKESSSKNARLNHVSSSPKKERQEDEHKVENLGKYQAMQKKLEVLEKENKYLKSQPSSPRVQKELHETHEDVGDATFSTDIQNQVYHVREQSKNYGSLFIIPVQIKGTEYPAMIDTGAESNFIHPEIVEQLKLKPRWCETVEIVAAGDNMYNVNHETSITIQLGKHKKRVHFYVSKLLQNIILGQPFIEEHSRHINLIEGTVFGVQKAKNSRESKQIQSNELKLISSNEFLRSIRSEETDLGLALVTEQTSENLANLPEFIQNEYEDVVTNESPKDLPDFKTITHKIHLIPGSKPTARSPYRMTKFETEELKKQINQLLKQGFIKKSNSPFAAPVLFVKKKDKSLRLCVDYRLLNIITIRDAFPIPVIDDLLFKLGNSKVFSKLDLMSGYFQIRMQPEHEERTAFVTPFGQYQWKVMPFGVTNGPATFQRFMNEVLEDCPNSLVYLDDILIHSESKEKHEKDIKRVLNKLREHKLIAKQSKCEFFKNELEFLGFTISDKGIAPNNAKVETIQNWPKPKNEKDAMKFMGLCNYYRRFVANFSKISAPINQYMSKHSKWTEVQDKAWNELKERLITPPILTIPDFEKRFRLTTDASELALGAVLEQVDDNGKLEGIIAFHSKKFLPAQTRYPIMEKEFLAVIEALKHFRPILYGQKFIIRSDHLNLLSLRSPKRIPQKRIAGWLDYLSEYDFDIQHIPGNKNKVADAISRVALDSVKVNIHLPQPDYDYDKNYREDPDFQTIYQCLKKERTVPKEIHNHIKHFKLHEDKIFYCVNVGSDHFIDRLCVPKGQMRKELIENAHDPIPRGHFGAYKTYYIVSEGYYWPRMFKDVHRYVKNCLTCQLTKHRTHLSTPLLQPLPIPEERWSSVSMDFITGFPPTKEGYNMIMTIIDRLTKVAHFIPTNKNATAKIVAHLFIDNVIKLHGVPNEIVSDKDIRFVKEVWKNLHHRLDIQLKFSSTNHPETDGQTERTNSIITRLLRSYASTNQTEWSQYLSMTEFAYNSTYQDSIHTTPFFADLGRNPDIPNYYSQPEFPEALKGEAIAEKMHSIVRRTQDFMFEAQRNQEKYANTKRTDISYHVGDMILLQRDAFLPQQNYCKLHPVYYGPFQLVDQSNEQAFEVDLPHHNHAHRILNTKWFKPFEVDPTKYPHTVPPDRNSALMRAAEGEILAIHGYDKTNDSFDVCWKSCHPGHATQLTRKDFKESVPPPQKAALLDNFYQLYPHFKL